MTTMHDSMARILNDAELDDTPTPVVIEPREYEIVETSEKDDENLQDDWQFVRQHMRNAVTEFSKTLPIYVDNSKFADSPQYYDAVSKAYTAFGNLANSLIDMNLKIKKAKETKLKKDAPIVNNGTVNQISVSGQVDEGLVDTAAFLAQELNKPENDKKTVIDAKTGKPIKRA